MKKKNKGSTKTKAKKIKILERISWKKKIIQEDSTTNKKLNRQREKNELNTQNNKHKTIQKQQPKDNKKKHRRETV